MLEKNKPVLAQLAKAPIAGCVKTRMIPVLSADQAVKLHCSLTERVVSNMSASNAFMSVLWISEEHNYFNTLSQRYSLPIHMQSDGDLGQRLDAIAKFYRHRPTLLIGSDCPFLTIGHIETCIEILQRADVVIIPATDGGYVCIGFKTYMPELFSRIDWGTERVLEQTLHVARRSGLNVVQLEPLADIDRPEDLMLLESIKLMY